MKLTFPTRVAYRDSYGVAITNINLATKYLSQPFGVNWAQDPSLYTNMGMRGHDGIDIPIPNGTPIYAAHNGQVFEVDNNDDRDGLGIELVGTDQNIRTIYWHNQKNLIRMGQFVKAGEKIAESGATGKAYGSHLHFGLYQTNELYQIINTNNGYKGAIDPMPYFVFEDMKITKELLPLLYKAILHREPDVDFWVDHDVDEFLRDTMNQIEWKKLNILITDARNLDENS
jgi:murein DD-endopeptidase MepM/ murein hydrolase activator NlpD